MHVFTVMIFRILQTLLSSYHITNYYCTLLAYQPKTPFCSMCLNEQNTHPSTVPNSFIDKVIN